MYGKLTGTERILRQMPFSSHSIIFNAFRLFEEVFGRRAGIRREVTATWLSNREVIYEYHTIEAFLVGMECEVRAWLKSMKPRLVRVYVPVLAPVGGYRGLSGTPYLFALAFDSGLNNQDTGTFAFNNVAGDFMIFAIRTISGETVTGVTYNSVALTNSVSIYFDPGDRLLYQWTLKSPATGSHNVVVSGPTVFRDIYTVTYSGADTSTNPGNTGTNSATGGATSVTVNLTTNSANDWLTAIVRNDSGSVTDGTNYVGRSADSSIEYGDSNASVGTGSQSITANGPSGSMYMAALVMRAAAAAGPTGVKTWNGVTQSTGIKTYLGVALASVKSVIGVT